MTKERDFDLLAQAWLELGPNEAPDRVVAAVLQAAETTPQVRRPFGRSFRRSFQMNRLSIAAIAVVLVAVVGGGIMLTRSSDQGAVGAPGATTPPSPAATTAPSPAASAEPVSASLLGRWMSGYRSVRGINVGSGTSIAFTDTTFSMGHSNQNDAPLITASASGAGEGRFRVVSTVADAAGCAPGVTGDYTWSLSAAGRHLAIQPVSDDCAGRLAAIPGDWVKMGCKNLEDNCLGDLAAGTYGSQFITPRLDPGASWDPLYGGVTYTVPAGWANSSDWPDTFTLTPSDDYAKEANDGTVDGPWHQVAIWRQPAAVVQQTGCEDTIDTAIPRTVDGLMAYFASLPAIEASAPQPITIDGHAGRWIDIGLRPDWTGVCLDTTVPSVVLFGTADGPGANGSFGIGGPERVRLIALDLGAGDVAMIVIDDGLGDRFDELVAEAMPIIESMTFK